MAFDVPCDSEEGNGMCGASHIYLTGESLWGTSSAAGTHRALCAASLWSVLAWVTCVTHQLRNRRHSLPLSLLAWWVFLLALFILFLLCTLPPRAAVLSLSLQYLPLRNLPEDISTHWQGLQGRRTGLGNGPALTIMSTVWSWPWGWGVLLTTLYYIYILTDTKRGSQCEERAALGKTLAQGT